MARGDALFRECAQDARGADFLRALYPLKKACKRRLGGLYGLNRLKARADRSRDIVILFKHSRLPFSVKPFPA